MAALGAVVKKAWSVRRAVVLLGAPLALLPVLLSLPAKVPRGHRAAAGAVRHRAGRGAGGAEPRCAEPRCPAGAWTGVVGPR